MFNVNYINTFCSRKLLWWLRNILYSSHFSIFARNIFSASALFCKAFSSPYISSSLNTGFYIYVCGLLCALGTNTTIRNQKKISDSCFNLLWMHSRREISTGLSPCIGNLTLATFFPIECSSCLSFFCYRACPYKFHVKATLPSRSTTLIFLVHLPER